MSGFKIYHSKDNTDLSGVRRPVGGNNPSVSFADSSLYTREPLCGAKLRAGEQFLARGRVHKRLTAIRRIVGGLLF